MMQLNRLITLLKRSSADAWEVTETRTRGWEFYFIRRQLDQNRAKDLDEIEVKVFKKTEDGEWMGSASAPVPVTASEEQAGNLIESLIRRASLVKDRPYALVRPCDGKPDETPVQSLPVMADAFFRTMHAVKETDTEDLNSYELFCSHVTKRFLNSEGVDVTMTYPSSMAEVVVNARNASKEIELYRMYRSGACDEEGLLRDVQMTLSLGRDRLVAGPTPDVNGIPVLFSTDVAIQIYYYFLGNLDAAYVFRKMSSFELGSDIAPEATGDRVTLKALRSLPNSSGNGGYDSEGAYIRDKVLMRDNVPEAYCGSRRYAQYMGLEDCFQVRNWSVEGGTRTDDEIRSGDYLEIMEFSDFQVDELTGDIFGEIRLGYLHQNGEVKIVTGGSVSGDMKDNLNDLQMSSRQVQYNNILIPALTKLSHVTVSGVEKQ